jgi:predicted transposase/invertase (TIGR01784 family)
MSRYLNPRNDIPFKRVFAQRKDLCISLLNALLPLKPDQQIVSIEYLPNDLLSARKRGKNVVADVRCTDQKHRQFIVEMQMEWTPGFMHRVVFEASRAYVNQLGGGEDYKGLKPLYLLSFVNMIFRPGTSKFVHDYQIYEQESGEIVDDMRWVLVELPKFRPTSNAQKRYFNFWLRYLTEIDEKTQEVAADLMAVPEIREAVKSLEVAAYTPGELAAYDSYWASVSSAKTLLREREERGEVKERRKNALGMKQEGFPLEAIARITGLSAAEIEAL